MEYSEFIKELQINLDLIHDSNKGIFLDILTKEAINKMEPVYEQ